MRIDGPGELGDLKRPAKSGRPARSPKPGGDSAPPAERTGGVQGRGDGVDISAVGKLLARLGKLPEIRADRVEELRRLVLESRLEEVSDLDEAVRGMLDDI